jgi:Sigma-70, region 4
MPHPSHEVCYEKRVAVITMRLLCDLKYAVIAEKLGLQVATVQRIYTRALQRTEPGLQNSFIDVVRNVKDAPRSGRPSKNRPRPDQPIQQQAHRPEDASRNESSNPPEGTAPIVPPATISGDVSQSSFLDGQSQARPLET